MPSAGDRRFCVLLSPDKSTAPSGGTTPGLNEPRSNHVDRITVAKQKPIILLNSCDLLDHHGYSSLIY
jgi:hypothetical protein